MSPVQLDSNAPKGVKKEGAPALSPQQQAEALVRRIEEALAGLGKCMIAGGLLSARAGSSPSEIGRRTNEVYGEVMKPKKEA